MERTDELKYGIGHQFFVISEDDDVVSVANFLLRFGSDGVQEEDGVLRGNGSAPHWSFTSEGKKEEKENKNGVQELSEFASLLHLTLSLSRRKLLICNSRRVAK